MGIEIEKKYLVKEIPKDIDKYPYHVIEQGYLNVSPAIRVRREDDRYYMTYKAAQPETEGDIGKAEYNLSLDEGSYAHMVSKADGVIIRKKRYMIPLNEDAYDKAYLNRFEGETKERVEQGLIEEYRKQLEYQEKVNSPFLVFRRVNFFLIF